MTMYTETTQREEAIRLGAELLDLRFDLQTLALLLVPLLPGLPLPCTCNDASCGRCRVEEILARHLPKPPPPPRPLTVEPPPYRWSEVEDFRVPIVAIEADA